MVQRPKSRLTLELEHCTLAGPTPVCSEKRPRLSDPNNRGTTDDDLKLGVSASVGDKSEKETSFQRNDITNDCTKIH